MVRAKSEGRMSPLKSWSGRDYGVYPVQAHVYFTGEAPKDQIISLVHPRLVTKPGLRFTSLDF